MSKLSFRARALDASKPMPIFMAEELPDLPDYSAINRAVPQMPSGMTKEEECEHHLQRAICAGLIIPTPEVTDLTDVEAYDKIYPADYKLPRQLIHMQPFAMEQDIPDYDMDSDDEKFVGIQSRKMDLTPLQFEEMMDRLEKSCGQTVTTINEAKALLKEDDDLIIAVYDFWLNKRLRLKLPLQATVKTDHRGGSAAGDPYLAFRRITEKMQTRKNRKNDETSYEKMLKLRRDLSRAVTLLELVKRREKTKREHLHLTIEVYEKRYQAEDFSGQILSEVSALKTTRPAFAPLFTNQFGVHQNWANKVSSKEDVIPRKEKRQYKKRKHKLDGRSSGLDESGLRSCTTTGSGSRSARSGVIGSGLDPLVSSDDENPFPHTQMSMATERDEEDTADEGPFAFRRNRYCNYLPPVSGGFGNWPWCDRDEGGIADKRYRFALTSISKPTPRCIGLARRRLGRGGRVILDRCPSSIDDIWSSLDFTIHESRPEEIDPAVTAVTTTTANTTVKKEWLHFRPKTPPASEHAANDDGASNCCWGMSNSSSSDDSETELTDSLSTTRSQPMPYPFPSEATSLCIDIEPDRLGDEAPFTSEFNISDYFSVDTLNDFDLGVTSITDDATATTPITTATATTISGSSRFQVTPLSSHVFSCRNQCSGIVSGNNSGGGKSVNNSSLSTLSNSSSSLSTLSSSSSTIILPSSSQTSTTSSNQSADISGVNSSMKQLNNQQNFHPHHHNQQRLFMNSSGGVGSSGSAASILSKSLTSPTSRSATSNVRVSGVTNFGNGHQNGPSTHIHTNSLVVGNSPVIQNSSGTGHLANSQPTIILPQKHSATSLLPGLIAQSKLASIARQQQQHQQQQMQAQPQQLQTQQQQPLATSGEITLNSNSEMEVDGVEGSPCESKPQQQQLVRANKTNSLAMEVT